MTERYHFVFVAVPLALGCSLDASGLPHSALGRNPEPDAGQDPRDQCADEGSTSCGHDGFCDGAGACGNYPAGTLCVPATCSGAMLYPERACDGGGYCRMVVPTSCAPYTCGSGACKTSCS